MLERAFNTKAITRANRNAHHEGTKNTKKTSRKNPEIGLAVRSTLSTSLRQRREPQLVSAAQSISREQVNPSNPEFNQYRLAFLRVSSRSSCLRGEIYGLAFALRF
jgi:hypothetical protein